MNDKCNNHLSWKMAEADISRDEAKILIKQLMDECDSCAWVMNSLEAPIISLIDVIEKAELNNEIDCPEEKELVEIVTGLMPIRRRIIVATHVLHCEKCNNVLFSEEGIFLKIERLLSNEMKKVVDQKGMANKYRIKESLKKYPIQALQLGKLIIKESDLEDILKMRIQMSRHLKKK